MGLCIGTEWLSWVLHTDTQSQRRAMGRCRRPAGSEAGRARAHALARAREGAALRLSLY